MYIDKIKYTLKKFQSISFSPNNIVQCIYLFISDNWWIIMIPYTAYGIRMYHNSTDFLVVHWRLLIMLLMFILCILN